MAHDVIRCALLIIKITILGNNHTKPLCLNTSFITEKSYQKIKTSFTCSRIGETNLKNKTNSLILYEVLD